MTEAEQVACDASRMAGLGEVADNLAWVREAARLREYIDETLQCDVEGYCASCGVHAESESHRLSCRLVSLFAAREGWRAEEIERAHGEALRHERIRSAGNRIDPASLEVGATFSAPQTIDGRVHVASELMKQGYVYGLRTSDFLYPKSK